MYNEKSVTKLFTALAEKITSKPFSIKAKVILPYQIKDSDSTATSLSIPRIYAPDKAAHVATTGGIVVLGATATVVSALLLATGTVAGALTAAAIAGVGAYSCLRMLDKEKKSWERITSPALTEIIRELKEKFLPTVQTGAPGVPLRLTVQFKEREAPITLVGRNETFTAVLMPYIGPLSPDDRLAMSKIYE